MKSNWSIIPLTVVGNSRQILSGGCIFCSNVTNDIYLWILYLLSYQLPCSQIIKTICSDDDVYLDSAFIKLSTDPIISCLKRIICIWHKLQQFKELVKKMQLTESEKNDLILKFKLMYSTRNEEKCIMIKNELKDISDLRDFIIKSIEPRLITSTKAYTKNVWSLGYITSSISECNNSNIKRMLGTKALTLCEVRDIITQSDKRRNMNRVYIKSRKTRKAFGQNVVKFMKSFMVYKRIAEVLKITDISVGHRNIYRTFYEKTL